MFSKLWKDEAGFVTLEYLLGATILVLGMIVGLSTLRKVITSELSELAAAIGTLSQNYSFQGLSACGAAVDGTIATGDLAQAVLVVPTDPSTFAVGQNNQNIEVTVCP